MSNTLKSTITTLALMLPMAAFGDVKGTTTLSANTALNLDTGVTAASGGDVLWTGTSMAPQGKATAYNAGVLGASLFGVISQSTLSAFAPLLNAAPIPASALVVGDVFAVKTNGGNYSAVLVTAVSGTSITLQFITFGAAPAGPTITQVLNNYSYTPAGFGNSGIAPDTLFVVIGSGLADAAAKAVLQSSSGAGLPSSLNGASIRVTVNGTTTIPVFYYAIATQLALVLPSNTPTGAAQITVTYNGQASAPYSFQVTQSAMGFDGYFGTGSGLAVATNPATGALYSYTNSIPPSTTITLWGSGLGADPTRDTTYVPAAFAINNLSHVYIGGVDAQILYQGASGFPGVNQVNVTIPASAPTGCNVALVGVTSDGTPTNFMTLPIGRGTCSDPAFGPLGGPLQGLSGQSSVKIGEILINHSTTYLAGVAGTTPMVTDLAIASFQNLGGLDLSGKSSGTVSLGGCAVSQGLSSAGSTISASGLDAGTITASSPNGATATLAAAPGTGVGTYFGTLPSGFVSPAGGSFPFHGSGGANVGAFNASVALPSPLLDWTNQAAAASVTRSSGLQITWNGGGSGSFVSISGTSVAAGTQGYGSFSCTAPVAAGQFAVPPYVLAALPAGTGALTVSNAAYSTFSAPGIDIGLGFGEVVYEVVGNFK